MRPELPHQVQVPDQAVVAQRVADEFGKSIAGTAQWSIKLPDARNNSVYAFWRTGTRTPGQRSFGEGYFDPATGQKGIARDTLGGDFFYRFHFQFHYMPVVWGRWLAGVAARFMPCSARTGPASRRSCGYCSGSGSRIQARFRWAAPGL